MPSQPLPTTKPTNPNKYRARERVSVWHCYECRAELNAGGILFHDEPAVIRVFTGTTGYNSRTGGRSACARHANAAIEQALRPLLEAEHVSGLLSVTAYAVVIAADDGQPTLGRRLWRATQRSPARGVVTRAGLRKSRRTR